MMEEELLAQLEDLQREAKASRYLIAALLDVLGGEIRIPDAVFVRIDSDTVIEVHHDDVTRHTVYRVKRSA